MKKFCFFFGLPSPFTNTSIQTSIQTSIVTFAMISLSVASAFAMAAVPNKPLRIHGSTTVAPVVSELAEKLNAGTSEIPDAKEIGKVVVDTQGGSKGGLLALKAGDADVAMISSSFSKKDEAIFAEKHMEVTRIGLDALALVVSKDVHDAGFKSISIQQIMQVYESKVTKWSELAQTYTSLPNGGNFGKVIPDRIVFFNKEPGRGTLEAFLTFVYGDASKAPFVSHPIVGSNQEVVSRVSRTKGAISILSAAWLEKSAQLAALGIEVQLKGGAKREVIDPTVSHIVDGTYPFVRPLNLVTEKNSANQQVQALIKNMHSKAVKEIIKKHGYLPAR